MKCRICSRKAVGEYCDFHEKAHRSVVQKYEEWKKAMGVAWKEYLNELLRNSYTGSWAKEVAENLISEKK